MKGRNNKSVQEKEQVGFWVKKDTHYAVYRGALK